MSPPEPGWRQPRIRSAAITGLVSALAFGWFPITVPEPEWTPAAVPSPGLDPSWIAGLNLAPLTGLRFGSDLIWTYGPWGRIDLPLVMDGWTFTLGLLFSLAATFGLGFLIGWALGGPNRPRWSPYLGIPLTGLLAFTPTPALGIAPSVRIAMTVTGLMLVLLSASTPRRETTWRWSLLGAVVSGGLLTVKFSEGVGSLLVVVVAGFFLRLGWWRWLLLLAAAAGSMTLTWLLAGQRMGDVVPWVQGSVELTRGYPTAMATQGVDAAGHPVGLYLSFALLCAAALVAAWRWRAILRDRWRLAGLVITVLAVCWIQLRVGFTQEGGQLTRSYSTLGVVLVVLLRTRAGLGVQVLLPVLAGALSLSVQSSKFTQVFDPATRVRVALDDVSAALWSPYREDLLEGARQVSRERYQLPQAMLDVIGNRSVHIDSTETTVAWSYGLRWRPAPIFQAYSVWTADLDRRNGQAFGSAAGPDLVLREPLRSIHGRQPLWDQPAAQRALLCEFRTLAQEQYWLLLERAADRCSAPEDLFTIEAKAGESVRLPPTEEDEVLLFSLEPHRSPAQRVQELAFKPFDLPVLTNDQGAYRLVPGTSGEPMIARIGSLVNEWSPQFGGRFDVGAFRLNQDATVTFARMKVNQP